MFQPKGPKVHRSSTPVAGGGKWAAGCMRCGRAALPPRSPSISLSLSLSAFFSLLSVCVSLPLSPPPPAKGHRRLGYVVCLAGGGGAPQGHGDRGSRPALGQARVDSGHRSPSPAHRLRSPSNAAYAGLDRWGVAKDWPRGPVGGSARIGPHDSRRSGLPAPIGSPGPNSL